MAHVRDQFHRLGGFTLRAVESNFHDMPLPYRLFLYITDACNCRCNMCSIWQKPTDGEMTTDEWLKVIDQAAPHVRWMDITGGEIFLHPGIEDIFRAVSALPKLFMFHFATNGILTDRILSGAEIIKRSVIPHFIVTVSLDGPEGLHNEIRGVPGIWDRCMATFKGLKRMGVPVVFGMTLTEHNHDEYERTVAAVREEIPTINHGDFHVNIAQISDLYYGNRGLIKPPRMEILGTVRKIAQLRGIQPSPVMWLERQFLKRAQVYLEEERSPITCEALSASCVLGTRGDVFPCIIYDAPVANLRDFDYSVARVWQERRRLELRQEIREGKCPQCWTPCEAYQSIIANSLPLGKNRGQAGAVSPRKWS